MRLIVSDWKKTRLHTNQVQYKGGRGDCEEAVGDMEPREGEGGTTRGGQKGRGTVRGEEIGKRKENTWRDWNRY